MNCDDELDDVPILMQLALLTLAGEVVIKTLHEDKDADLP